MKSFFEEIYTYQNEVNQDILKQLLEMKTEIPAKVLDLLSHSMNAHRLWNYRILAKTEKVNFVSYPKEELLKMDMENFKDTLSVLKKKELNESIKYTSTSGKKYSNTIQEILTQVSQHFQYHRGQIVSEMLKHNVKMKPTDYIYYRRREV